MKPWFGLHLPLFTFPDTPTEHLFDRVVEQVQVAHPLAQRFAERGGRATHVLNDDESARWRGRGDREREERIREPHQLRQRDAELRRRDPRVCNGAELEREVGEAEHTGEPGARDRGHETRRHGNGARRRVINEIAQRLPRGCFPQRRRDA